jgi:HD superfamily phosphodiesterase
MNELNDISHDYNHIKLVIKMALEIASKEGVNNPLDLFHIKMGALLHDIGDSKYTNGEIQAVIIDNFLKKIKELRKEDRKEIIYISSNISLSKDDNIDKFNNKLKLNIVQDADRINSLGAIGIMRYISYNMKNSKEPSFGATIENMKKRTNKIMRFIRTKTGKIIAKKHVKIINEFIKNYDLMTK